MIIILGSILTYFIGLAVWMYLWGYIAGKNGKKLFDRQSPADTTLAREEGWALVGFLWPLVAPLVLLIKIPLWFFLGLMTGAQELFDYANRAAFKIHERKVALESVQSTETSLTKERAAA